LKEVAKKVKLKEYVDANTITINRDGYFRSAYVIDLPLDSVPDHAWQDILDREWRASSYPELDCILFSETGNCRRVDLPVWHFFCRI
jgi:hypothetical protein